MRNILLTALLCLPTSGITTAQSDPPPPPPPATTADPATELAELQTSFDATMVDWRARREEAFALAEKDGTRVPKSLRRPPSKEFIETAMAAAERLKGTPDAVGFLVFTLENATSERKSVRSALEALEADHVASPAIAGAIQAVGLAWNRGARKAAASLLDKVIANNTDTKIQAQALIARGKARLDGRNPELGIEDLERASKVSQDASVLALAQAAIAEFRQFEIGAVAPDIEGVDIDGIAFKLSDYRGKAVLLDFWGFW